MAPSNAEATPRGVSIRIKVVATLLLLAVVPAAVVSVLLSRQYRDSVYLLEAQHQEAVVAEASAKVIERVRRLEDDAKAVAQALALAAAQPSVAPSEAVGGAAAPSTADGLDGVRAVLATRQSFDAVRFEVPSARISTVLSKEKSPAAAPESDAALRKQADERGVAFVVRGDRGLLVVPVPRAPNAKASGYVTTQVDLSPLQAELTKIALRRLEGARIVLADSQRRAVATVALPDVAVGSDVSRLPIWSRLPEGAPWTAEIGVVGEMSLDGEPQIAAVRTISELGWAVGSYRSAAVAYRTLDELERVLLLASLAALLGALVFGFLLSSALTRPVLALAKQADLIGGRKYAELELPVRRGDELGELARSMGQMARDLQTGEEELKREAQVRGDLSRFLSRELVDAVVNGKQSLSLGGRRAEVTVLFADVVAFTPMAESRDAEQVVTLLNELFTMLSEIVFRHGGMVDKFIGDCIMAVWGATEECPDHAERALRAAEDMLRFLETTNEDWRGRFDLEIRLGIGVNSGEAIVGNVGSDKRMEFTVVGDVVNVAARLEAIARPNQVLLGERTQQLAPEVLPLTDLGAHELTGRQNQARVFGYTLGDD
ncbi:MAG TPA: adenylate/guanylate cyclase domain-containing protein [Polyangiaceae bacterium]|nr:adenylate/guanylate cyclase domain-containing protein [Polyangiaceae bacterium]